MTTTHEGERDRASDGDRDGDHDDREGQTAPSDEPVDRDPQSGEPFGLDANPDPDRQDGEHDPSGDASAETSAASGTNADAPLGSLAASVDERRGRDAERPDDGLFDVESVSGIDTDVVWEQLDDDEPPEPPDDAAWDVRVVKKSDYCEQCPYFSDPPDVQCSHDGTEILELVDMEHFRVVDCPKVREDERLEQL